MNTVAAPFAPSSARTAGTHRPAGLDWLEDAPREQVLAYQWQRLGAYLRWLEGRSPFWQNKLRAAGVSAGDVSDWEAFRRLPTTDKSEQAQALESGQADYGGLLCRPLDELKAMGAVYWRTTGTTGKQRAFVASSDEFDRTCVRACARVVRMAGIGPGDSVAITAPVNFWIAGLGLYLACRSIGATPLMLGPPFDSRTKLALIEQYRPDALFLTPTFALRLGETAREAGIDLPTLGIRTLMVGGEVTTDETRAAIRKLWQPTLGIRDCGGMSETTGWMFSDCEAEQWLHLFEDIHHCDITDPNDPSKPVAEGEIGELIVTSFLQRDLVPAFRFRTNDLVRHTDQPCACGRTHRRLRYIGRRDDMRIIGGINVFPSTVEAVVRDLALLNGHFRLSTPERGEYLQLRAEHAVGLSTGDLSALDSELKARLRQALGLNVRVQLLAPDTLERFEVKSRLWEPFDAAQR
ncbi:MAG: phenylacetate--CoA ligase family protein [Burkholderiaceae bacterium]